jgi:hypothetical protein
MHEKPKLRADYEGLPIAQRLSPLHPRWMEIMARHNAAVGDGKPTYADPSSGIVGDDRSIFGRSRILLHIGVSSLPVRASVIN